MLVVNIFLRFNAGGNTNACSRSIMVLAQYDPKPNEEDFMKNSLSRIVFAVALFLFGASAFAADAGTAEEAIAMVKKASAYLKENGQPKALEAFNNPKGAFVDRDLYIFVVGLNGLGMAHGANIKLVGKDMRELRDPEGNYFIKSMLDLAKTKGKGWVDYKWPDPVSKTMQSKTTYIEKHDDLMIGCGIYKR